ncbi:MAG: carboxypeptidase-like regulatory domain-containing protein, partial [Chryseobacterium sp.]
MKTRLLFFILLLYSAISFAQTKISGKVTYKNKGVGAVNVTLRDTYDGATTDANGDFSFETSEKGNHILTFTHPKYIE